MAFLQVCDTILSKLDCRDAIIFSTLSKDLYALQRRPIIRANLQSPQCVVSHIKWMQRHGSGIRDLSLTCDHPISHTALYACLVSPHLTHLKLNLLILDQFALNFLPCLEVLDITLSSDQEILDLGSIPFLKLRQLRLYSRSGISMIELPAHFPSLTSLELSRMRFPRFPNAPNLLKLAVPRCELDENLVVQMSTLTTLTSLDVVGCKLSHAPHEFMYLTKLQDLNLSKNGLINYDTDGLFIDDTLLSIERLPNLTHLDVSHNYIDSMGMNDALPKLECPKLESLDVSCNPCVDIPNGAYLRRLKTLRASFIPTHLTNATALCELKLHGHCQRHAPNEELPPSIDAVHPPASLESISIHDSHIHSRLVSDVLSVVKKKPSLRTHFSMLSYV